MSNKLLAWIILVCFFWLLFGAYFYFFIFYSASLIFQWNTSGYTISLVATKVAQNQDFFCEETTCIYKDIPPLEYQIQISKEGFETYIITQDFSWNKTYTIPFELEKETILSQLSPKKENQILSDKTSQKITRLKYKDFFLYYDFWEEGVFYMREYLWKLFLYHDHLNVERLIYDFEKIWQDKIHIAPIFWTDYFIVHVDGKNYLYDSEKAWFQGIDLRQRIEYGKTWKSTNEFIFVTSVWSYVYDLKLLKSEYFVIFSDFVILGNDIILWVLKKDDKKRRKNLWLSQSNNDQLYNYNIQTKEIKKIYETWDSIAQIYFVEDELILEINGELKQLQNFDI